MSEGVRGIKSNEWVRVIVGGKFRMGYIARKEFLRSLNFHKLGEEIYMILREWRNKVGDLIFESERCKAEIFKN